MPAAPDPNGSRDESSAVGDSVARLVLATRRLERAVEAMKTAAAQAKPDRAPRRGR